MIDKILEHPFMFIVMVGTLILLHMGAMIRVRHENNLRKRSHPERRKSPRLMPNNKLSAKRRKKR